MAGSNQPETCPEPCRRNAPNAFQEKNGEGHYGYRSLPFRLVDPLRRFSLTLLNDVQPANLHEDLPPIALLLQLAPDYTDLCVDAMARDADLGFEGVLHAVYQ